MKNKKAVVLLSGGLDSAVGLYFAKSRSYDCHCLTFNYGQKDKIEIAAARRIARHAGCPIAVLDIALPWKGSSLLDKNIAIPKQGRWLEKGRHHIPSTYVPGRNIIFLSFALSYAEAIGARAIFIGAHSQDYSGYPDCRPRFYRAFSGVIGSGTKAGVERKGVKIYTPLIKLNKAGIIRMGVRLGAPLKLTRSCYEGQAKPCGTCDSCRFRARGFKEAGIGDPALTQ